MERIVRTLYYIYKNRWEGLVYRDLSKGIILLILYVSALVFLYNNISTKYICYCLFFLIFTQTIKLHIDRKDYDLLAQLYKGYRLKLLFLVDYLFLNLPILILILLSNKLYFGLSILLILSISFIKITFRENKLLYFPLSNQDPLWKTYIRKHSYIFLLVFISYYINYQGIKNDNINLSLGAYLIIPFLITLSINGGREKIIFLRQSKLTEKTYLFNIIKVNIFNTLIFTIPNVLINIIYLEIYVVAIIFILFFVIQITCLRYILFFNTFLFNLLSAFLLLLSLVFAFDGKIRIIGLIIFFIINFFLFKNAIGALKRIKNSYDYK